jgi:iron complex outermembrane receptor protein
VPGGNRELKAESGWTEELTLETKTQRRNFAVSYSITAYNRNIRNMITWVPVGAYWSPQNVAGVHSYGLEHRLKATYRYMRWKFDWLANADYVRSTYGKSNDPDDVSAGNQLIYVPAWFGSTTLTAQWTEVFVTASWQYVDHRFTSRDHTEWLPAYAVVNIGAGWSTVTTFRGAEYGIDVFIRCNNLTDAQYQTVAWRPMPGRNFMVGCTIDFSKQKTIK